MLIKWFFVGSFSFLRCRQHWLLLECNLSYNLQRRFVGLHDLAACHRLPKQEAKTHVALARLGIVTADDLCCLFLCNRFFLFFWHDSSASNYAGDILFGLFRFFPLVGCSFNYFTMSLKLFYNVAHFNPSFQISLLNIKLLYFLLQVWVSIFGLWCTAITRS